MGWSEQIKVIGGLVAVAVGVVAVMVITLVALAKDSQTAGTIASAAGGVIASIVGAFFGVKLGRTRAATPQRGSESRRPRPRSSRLTCRLTKRTGSWVWPSRSRAGAFRPRPAASADRPGPVSARMGRPTVEPARAFAAVWA